MSKRLQQDHDQNNSQRGRKSDQNEPGGHSDRQHSGQAGCKDCERKRKAADSMTPMIARTASTSFTRGSIRVSDVVPIGKYIGEKLKYRLQNVSLCPLGEINPENNNRR